MITNLRMDLFEALLHILYCLVLLGVVMACGEQMLCQVHHLTIKYLILISICFTVIKNILQR